RHPALGSHSLSGHRLSPAGTSWRGPGRLADPAKPVTTRARTLLLSAGALVLAGALGLYAYFGVLRREEKAAADKEAKEKLVAPVPETDGGAAGAWGRLQGHLVRYDKLVLTARGETTELGRLP